MYLSRNLVIKINGKDSMTNNTTVLDFERKNIASILVIIIKETL